MLVKRIARSIGEARLVEEDLRKMGAENIRWRGHGLWRTRPGRSFRLDGELVEPLEVAQWARLERGGEARPTHDGDIELEGELPDAD